MWDHFDSRDDARDRQPRDVRHEPPGDPRDVFSEGLELPRGAERERVFDREHEYDLRGSEVRTLSTIGAFRVVAVDDLREASERAADRLRGDLERLRASGLIRAVGPLNRANQGGRTTVVTLTDRGRDLLERHRTAEERGDQQAFYAGAVKPRELSHDAQLFRSYLRAAERLQKDDGRIRRVVLDYELKREYQSFLQERNRSDPASDGRPARTPDEIRRWADEHHLPMVDGRVQFPDFRIEYERANGVREVEDVEVMTTHYRGAHAAAKARAGFTRFRAGGRGGGRARGGGRPPDPRLAEEFLE